MSVSPTDINTMDIDKDHLLGKPCLNESEHAGTSLCHNSHILDGSLYQQGAVYVIQ